MPTPKKTISVETTIPDISRTPESQTTPSFLHSHPQPSSRNSTSSGSGGGGSSGSGVESHIALLTPHSVDFPFYSPSKSSSTSNVSESMGDALAKKWMEEEKMEKNVSLLSEKLRVGGSFF